jgi:hypothetical protein
MLYGFRSYQSFCPFCGTFNIISDGTGAVEEIACSHFLLVCSAGRDKDDMVFRSGKNEKSGLCKPIQAV